MRTSHSIRRPSRIGSTSATFRCLPRADGSGLPSLSPAFSTSAELFFGFDSAEPLKAAELHVKPLGDLACGIGRFVVPPDAGSGHGPWSGRSLAARALQPDERTLEAVFRRDEPPLTCGDPYHYERLSRGATPVYPLAAGAAGISGRATVKVTLGNDGSVVNATIYRSSGYDSLDSAAIDAAKNSSFEPETFRCVGYPGSYLFTADFGAGLSGRRGSISPIIS